MRYLLALLFVVVFTGKAYSATITLTIPDEKLERVTNAIKGIYPIPDNDGDGELDYTPNQWAKEYVRQWVRDTVYRWEVIDAKRTAGDSIGVDDSICE